MGSVSDEKRLLKNGDSSMLIPQLKCKRQIVSAIRSFPSGSVNSEKRHLKNGDSSMLTPQLKCKRQIVSAIRTFPSGCGPRASTLCKQKAQGVNEENMDVVSKEVLKDAKSCGKKRDLSEAAMGFVNAGERHLENGDFSMLTPLPKCKRQKVSAVRKFPSGCGPNATSVCKQRVQGVDEPERKGLLEQVAPPNYLNEVEMKDSGAADPIELAAVAYNQLGEGTNMEERCLLPHNPIPSEFVCVEHKYPSPVCGLPADCGRNLTSLGYYYQVIKGKTITKTHETITKTHEAGVLNQNERFLKESNNQEDVIQVTVSGKGGDTHEKPSAKEEHLLPHCPIQHKYPSPVCGLPADCGRNLTSLGHHYQVIKGKTITKMHEAGVLNQNERFLKESNNQEDVIQVTVSGKGGDTHEKPSAMEERLLPHYPISSNLEHEYSSPVCGLPADCSRNLTTLSDNFQVIKGKTITKMHEAGVLNQNEGFLEGSNNCEDMIQETVSRNGEDTHEEPSAMEERSLPHYPIPSNREHEYSSPVRGLPADCGRNLTSLGHNYQVIKGKTITKMHEAGVLNQSGGFLGGNNNCENMIQETVSRKDGDTHEKPSGIDEGIAEKLITQAHTLGQSSQNKRRKKKIEDDKNEQHMQGMELSGYDGKDESAVGSLPDMLKNDTMVFKNDKDKRIKSKSDGSSCNNNALQPNNSAVTEIERGGIVLALMCAAFCPWRQVKDPTKLSPSSVSANKSKGKKHGYDAQLNEKCSRTNHQDIEEKLTEEPKIEDNKDEQHMQGMEQSGYNGNDGSAVGSLLDVLKNDPVVLEKDKDKKIKSKSDGASRKNIALQQKNGAVVDIERGTVVLSLACAASCPWRQVKGPAKLNSSEVSAKESKEKPIMNVQLVLGNDKDNSVDEEHVFEFLPRPRNHDVTLPPFVASSSSKRGPRTKVQETLRLFEVLVKNMLQGVETNSEENGKDGKSVHLRAANVLKEQGKYINTEKVIGPVPGVEIGDSFSYRLELAIIGLHSPLQSGIETIREGDLYVATSVVASGNDVAYPNVLIYTGQGGNPMKAHKLDCENLALKNCIDNKNPVRVIRGFKQTNHADNGDRRPKLITTYTYDGLYTVERYWPHRGPRGKVVYKFELIRIPGQHQLTWKEVEQAKNSKLHESLSADDISNGKENIPISAVNTVDDEKPPPFTYITSRIYPDWCRPLPLKGCDCKTGCSDSNRCACTLRNGGEIPYNLSGAIVEAKNLVYECGPSCKCPPSCPSRVGQHGIKLPLEIFKTEFMGWGVRCLSSIPSGSFICEYIGELLDDKEAEQRVGGDEYLFDIGRNYNDTALSDGVSGVMPEIPSVVENVGFTIDAARYGNIGRFFNHSCSPNLYAQNVLYDHEDERVPHVMLFAAEDIPPLQELTYHYNYTIDQVFDSKGNIKTKKCCCGSIECTGRMY